LKDYLKHQEEMNLNILSSKTMINKNKDDEISKVLFSCIDD
jgi:hypothetical protein